MIVKGSMSYDIHGRKRKKVRKTTKKATNKWQKATKSDIHSNKMTKSSKK